MPDAATPGKGQLPGPPVSGAGASVQTKPTGGTGSKPRPARAAASSRQRRIPSVHEVVGGVRRVKGYPITRDELFELGGAGSLATICFSVGGGLLGRSYDIQQDLEMNQITAPELQARWQAKESDYFYFGIFLLAIGAIAFLAGGAKIWSIIKSTEHPND